jgi:hypothetical protein
VEFAFVKEKEVASPGAAAAASEGRVPPAQPARPARPEAQDARGEAPPSRSGSGPEAARPEPGPLAEKVRKRFDGRYLEQE